MRYIAFMGQGMGSRLKRALALLLLAVIATLVLLFFFVSSHRTIPILMYHEVAKGGASSLVVSPENFAKQMEFLHKSGYKVISLDEFVSGINEGKGFMPKTVVITFDDGLNGNYLNAFPVLAKYKMPATIFLVTGSVSVKEGYLTWDQARLMASNGIDLGGHTRNHVYLPSVPDLRVMWDEVAGCKEDIEKNTGVKARYFCYPTGGFDPRVEETVKKAGYAGACTTNRGKDRLNRNVYELNRVKVTNSDMSKPFHFTAKLSGCYNIFRRMKDSNDGYMGKRD
jgi:peptidoglycan/xylan/chitin deacetylase (PgdA/CDA1 family)